MYYFFEEKRKKVFFFFHRFDFDFIWKGQEHIFPLFLIKKKKKIPEHQILLLHKQILNGGCEFSQA